MMRASKITFAFAYIALCPPLQAASTAKHETAVECVRVGEISGTTKSDQRVVAGIIVVSAARQ